MNGSISRKIYVIAGVGMVSSLGRGAVASCAAARAGISLATELSVVDASTQAAFGVDTDDGPPVLFGHVAGGIADGFVGVGKALLLGVAAIRDLLERRPLSSFELSRTGLCVNLSDYHVEDTAARRRPHGEEAVDGQDEQNLPSVQWRSRTNGFADRLIQMLGIGVATSAQSVCCAGPAGFALALQQAMTLMQAGKADRCLVGGIDSRIEPRFLYAAAELGILRMNVCPVGLMPGEGAAFVLVERSGSSNRMGVGLKAVAVHRDSGSILDVPSSGRALADAIADVASDATSESWFVGDLNGTESRALEWGNAVVRLGWRRVNPGTHWCPASDWGDTGAASGAMGFAAVVRAFQRGYAPGKPQLFGCRRRQAPRVLGF